MKKILKTLFILMVAFVMFLSVNKSDAATFKKLDIGCGKSIISQNYMTWDYSSGVYVVKTTGAFPMKKGEVFAVYGSYSFVGDISKTTGVSYRLYNDDGSYKDYNSKWQLGGWYGTSFLENKSGTDTYIEILDFGVPYGMLSDDVVEEVEVRKVSSVGEFNFDGYSICFSSNDYYLASEAYTLIVSDEILLTDEEILKNFVSNEYGGKVAISIKENNYKQEAGNYICKVQAKDAFNNITTYDLNILVYATQTPTILGPDAVNLYLSKFSTFSVDSILNSFVGSYYGYTYKLSISSEELEKLYYDYGICCDTKITIDCKFSDGTTVSKTIDCYVFDDTAPDLYIKKVVYLTDYVNSLSIGEIITLISKNLKSQNIDAENISLIDFEEMPTEAGTYKINFKYDEAGNQKIGELSLVLKDKMVDTYINTILTKTVTVNAYRQANAIQMIEQELLNKGINATNIIITSDEDSIPATQGEYDITFTYEEGNLTQNGKLTLTLTTEDNTSSNSNSYINYIIVCSVVVVLGIVLIVYKKKRHHM